MKLSRTKVSVIVSAVAVALFGVLNIFVGSVDIPAADILKAIVNGDAGDPMSFMVTDIRIPGAVTAALCGAALASAGLMLQTVFANPLADPSVLGINAGASLGVALAVLLLGGGALTLGQGLGAFMLTSLAAFAGAALVLALLVAFAATLRNGLVLLIAGIMVSYIVSAVIELLYTVATAEGIRSYVFWGMGNFGGVSREMLPAFSCVMIIALVGALAMIKPLNAMLLGENYASNLGVSVRRARLWVFVITGVLSAVPTAMCGPVAFIGLAVPHMARFASGTSNHRALIPLTMLMGAAVALVCRLICSVAWGGAAIPLNVVTSLWGVPVILYVLFASSRRKGWG